MTDQDETTGKKPRQSLATDRSLQNGGARTGERIAKAMARAGVASRREAERMITEGRVSVNGRKTTSPALDITSADKVLIDGHPMDEPQQTRLWLYYKPVGLVTSEVDGKGRQTVFDALPRELPRVMSVGRLDLNSEGLLLLTNDGDLKRRLELPSTGWLRRYRVRVNGRPNDLTFDPLRRGATIDGENFQPMEIRLDSQQGANAWLTVGIREGKNREIRRGMTHVGLMVNRLIRVGYGPFKLMGMEKNEVREIRLRVLRDQLGALLTGEVEEVPRKRDFRERGASGASGRERRESRRLDNQRPQRDGGGRGQGKDGPNRGKSGGEHKPSFDRPERGERRFARSGGPRSRKDGDDRPAWGSKHLSDGGSRPKPYGQRAQNAHSGGRSRDGDARQSDERKPGGRKTGDAKQGGRKSGGPRSHGEKGDRQAFGNRRNDEGKSRSQSESRSGIGKPAGRGTKHGPARRDLGKSQPGRRGGSPDRKYRHDGQGRDPRGPRNPQT